jgi:hypothetical protein
MYWIRIKIRRRPTTITLLFSHVHQVISTCVRLALTALWPEFQKLFLIRISKSQISDLLFGWMSIVVHVWYFLLQRLISLVRYTRGKYDIRTMPLIQIMREKGNSRLISRYMIKRNDRKFFNLIFWFTSFCYETFPVYT